MQNAKTNSIKENLVAKNAKIDDPSVSTNNKKETISQKTILDQRPASKTSSKSQSPNSQLDKLQTPKSQSQSPKLQSPTSPEMNISDAEMEGIIQDHFTLKESVTQLLKKSNKDTNHTSKKMAKCKYCWWSLLQNTAQQYKHLMLNHKDKIVLGSGSHNIPARSPPTSLPTSGGSKTSSHHQGDNDRVQDNSDESTNEKNKSNKDSSEKNTDENNRSIVILESDDEDDGIVLDPRMNKPQSDVVSTTKKNLDNQCHRCSLIFSNPYHNHKRYEAKPLQFCPVCPYKSCTGNGLGSHVRKEHPDTELVVESRKRKSNVEEESSNLTKLTNITDDPNPGDGQTKILQNCVTTPPPSKKSKVSQPEKETVILAPNPNTLLPASKETNSTEMENEAMARTLANLSGRGQVAVGGEQQPVSDQSVSSSSDAFNKSVDQPITSEISITDIKLEQEPAPVAAATETKQVKKEENIKLELELLAEQSRKQSVTYQCEFCDQRFKDLMGIKTHVEDGHNVLFTNDGSHVVNPDSVPPSSVPSQNDSDEEYPEEDDNDFPQMKIQSVETLKLPSPVKPVTPEKPVNKCDKCDQGKKL